MAWKWVSTLKPLAVSGSNRLAFHPDVPTITETGVTALELESWFGLFAPAKTPAEALVREAFEEAGLLFATDADGKTVDLDALPQDEVVALRRALSPRPGHMGGVHVGHAQEQSLTAHLQRL